MVSVAGYPMQAVWLKSTYATAKTFIAAKIKEPSVLAKFLAVSGSAVILNLVLLYLLVNYCGLNTTLGENIANIISMEIAIVYNFFMSRSITWRDRRRENGIQLLWQILKFHITIGITIVFRVVLFFLLQLAGIQYMLNAAIGIAISALFNFVVYDTLIFKKGVV
jgi:dolichol-phosphate mannosyltransferase